ncbi:protein D2-like [Montipora capricornis]|uniref:protein D2-like n=1 Tax=Montipora foliosa TaxID=591990 RepID=UPI0035F1841A
MAPSHICIRLFAFCLLPFHGFHGLNGYRSFSDDRTSLTDEECGGFDNLSVHFGDYYFDCGQEVPLDQVNTQAPTVAYKKADESEKYLIAMVDPDAPYEDDPIYRSWLHWIVANVNGGDLLAGDTSGGDTFMKYAPPSPPKPKPGSQNDHRYFIYVFKQKQELDSSAQVADRKSFDIDEYREKLDLEPVAMNMFSTHRPEVL